MILKDYNMDLNFTRLPHTCSMIELGQPYLDKWSTKKTFLYHFDNWLQGQQMSRRENKRYSILYNCTCDTRYKHLTRIGFQEVFAYKGERNVKVLIMDVNKLTKMTFWEWFKS